MTDAQQPAGRPPAPGPLGLLQDLVNTRDVEADTDVFATPEGLGRWLSRHDLLAPGERITSAEALARATALREALRQLLVANHDGRRAPEPALTRLNEIAAGAPLVADFDADGGWTLQPAGEGVDRALGRLLAAVADAMSSGEWQRLKMCREHTCQWAFYDTSRNRSGKWCSMAICGNRTKARAFRDRHAETTAEAR